MAHALRFGTDPTVILHLTFPQLTAMAGAGEGKVLEGEAAHHTLAALFGSK